MDEFLQGYIKCALWSSTDDDETPLDENYEPEDLASETLKQMEVDCKDFQTAQTDLLAQYVQTLSMASAGHDFWLTRNHHGAGFWDRGLGELGQKLTDAAHPYGSCDLYVGDDCKIYAS